jgi:single-stranded-DNA-specific exonuclease
MQWIEQQAEQSSVSRLQKELGISPLLARLLVQRGLTDSSKAQAFLKPKLKDLDDPFAIRHMDLAISKILNIRDNKQKVLLLGDYDVDGISSTVMTKQALESIGLVVETIIPKRLSEGYGLTQEALERGLSKGTFGLVIALDCGTNSIAEADYLHSLGIDLIVVDHHQQKGGSLPKAILINPHIAPDQGEPWRHLCTAGLCFKLIHALYKRVREMEAPGSEELTPRDYLPLCAIGTLADLVPLQGESRILSRFGMMRLFMDASPGLLALLKECGLEESIEPETEDITFKLAPRVNACGRLNEPETAVSLLLEKHPNRCRSLAQKLTQFNEERKGIEAQLTIDALAQAEENFRDSPAVIVTGDGDGWHPGVVGIVAGKLANSLNKPCLVLARGEADEYCGSGRSVPGVNLVEILSRCQNRLTHWGGHPVAVGLGLKESERESFIAEFIEAVENCAASIPEESSLSVDAFIDPDMLKYELLDEINSLGPFGQGNEEPLLGIKKIVLDSPPRPIGNGEHFQFSIRNGSGYIRGVAWRMGDRTPQVGQKIDLLFKLRKNFWNGRSSLQLVLEDWKPS